VGPAEVMTIIEFELCAFVGFGGVAAKPPDKPPGHAQVHDEHAAVVQAEEEVLSAAPHRKECPADEVGAQGFDRCTSEQSDGAFIDIDARNGPALDERLEVAANGLDFRKFRHGLIVEWRLPVVDSESRGRPEASNIRPWQGTGTRFDDHAPAGAIGANGCGWAACRGGRFGRALRGAGAARALARAPGV